MRNAVKGKLQRDTEKKSLAVLSLPENCPLADTSSCSRTYTSPHHVIFYCMLLWPTRMAAALCSLGKGSEGLEKWDIVGHCSYHLYMGWCAPSPVGQPVATPVACAPEPFSVSSPHPLPKNPFLGTWPAVWNSLCAIFCQLQIIEKGLHKVLIVPQNRLFSHPSSY